MTQCCKQNKQLTLESNKSYASRKFVLSIVAVVLVTLLSVLSIWFQGIQPILSTFISGVIGVLSLYFAGNVANKYVIGKQLNKEGGSE